MIVLRPWAEKAQEKIKTGEKNVAGQKEKAMAGAVADALLDFCRQNEEFAQAVVEGGSFTDCMKKVAQGVGNSISDLDAYKKAVQFYFPGARIQLQMSIDLVGKAAQPEKVVHTTKPEEGEKPKIISLNLADFL